MYVIQTSGVNFINIIHANFSYKCFFGSFFYLHTHVHTQEKAAKMTIVLKICTYNVDEIDGRCQFHQRFMCAFFVLFSPKCNKRKALLYEKWANKMFVILTSACIEAQCGGHRRGQCVHYKQICDGGLDCIDRCQFHQHFTRSFYTRRA